VAVWVDLPEEGTPLVEVLRVDEFAAHGVLAVEKKLGEISESLRLATRNAIGSNELEELADNVMNVANGLEAARERSEFRRDGFEILELLHVSDEPLLLVSVKDAESGMGWVAEHAAGASVGEGELAERGFVGGDSGARGFHL